VVEHLVALRLKPETSRADADALLAAIRGLPAQVPGILELQCGWNISPARARGFELGVRVRFPGRAELAAYGPHPAHAVVSARIQQLCAEVLVLDLDP